MPPNTGHLTTTPYCFLYKQECHSICCGGYFFPGIWMLVFSACGTWLLPSEYLRNLTRKHQSKLGIRAKILGWFRWIFLSGKVKPCQSSLPHTWYFSGRFHTYVCQTASLSSLGNDCCILEPPSYLSYRSSLFCSHGLSFRRAQYNWL